jgi:antitoxin ParD1/3/4
MPKVPIQVTLDSDSEAFVNECVREGKYTDASAVIRHGLILLREQELMRGVDMDELRRGVQLAMDELDRGEGEEVTDEFFRQLRERGMKRLAEERQKGG